MFPTQSEYLKKRQYKKFWHCRNREFFFLSSSVWNVLENCCPTFGHLLLSVLNFKAHFIYLLQFKLKKCYVRFTCELEKAGQIHQNRGAEEEHTLPDQSAEIAVVKIDSAYGLFSLQITKKTQTTIWKYGFCIKHQKSNNRTNSSDFIRKKGR